MIKIMWVENGKNKSAKLSSQEDARLFMQKLMSRGIYVMRVKTGRGGK